MKMTLGRKILTGFIACALILFGVAIFSFNNSAKFIASNAMVNHTNKVLSEFNQILVFTIDAETGTRGFVITGDDNFLEPFSDAKTKGGEHLDKVRELTKDNPNQQKNIEELDKELKLRFNHLDRTIDLRKKDFEKGKESVASGEGKQIQDRIRKIIDRAEGIEYALLVERKQTSEDDAGNFNLVFAFLLLIIIIILVIVYIIVIANLRALKRAETETADKNWLLTGNTELNNKIQGEKEVSALAQEVINQLTSYMKAQIGTIYLAENGQLNLAGSYAFHYRKDNTNVIKLGQGLVGQAALEKKTIIFSEVPDDYIKINSGLGNLSPKHIIVFPFQYAGQLKGVIEIGSVKEFSELDMQFLNLVAENIGTAFNSSQSRTKLKELFEETHAKQIEIDAITTAIYKSNIAIEFDLNGNVLKANDIFKDTLGYKDSEIIGRHHSLFVEKGYETTEEYNEFWNNLKKGVYQTGEFKRIANSGEIVWLKGNYNPIFDVQGNPYKILKIATDVTLARKQALELAQQAEELQVQQEELKQMNEELEEQTLNLKQQQEELQMSNEELEEQTQSLEEKNKEVEEAKNNIEQKTKQLEISSKYKSEFLANMSHELRTPLNSLLILSKDLAENRKKNLDNIQVESAEIIYKSGAELLVLINEVLDLSKIEAGKMLINSEKVSLKFFTDELIRDFKHHAEQKGLTLNAKLDKKLPESINTDLQRLNQILKNLLSNAIKFTEKGSVTISIDRYRENSVIISVTDTGIGIPKDKQMIIFEAFQQAEGGTSRKYGGTGLGLSISRELAKLLGAEITLSSKLNEGSVFSLIIPFEKHEQEPLRTNTLKEPFLYIPRSENDPKYLNYPGLKDDRDLITTDDIVVLIIEDDLTFASILLKQANQKGFKCLAATTGEDGLLLAAKYLPQAIILDMGLPGISGHEVLLELKANPSVRHIPVHIISANERSLEPIQNGAIECLVKPIDKKDLEEAFNRIEIFVSRKMKNLLIIEDNENSRKALRILIGNGDVKCFEAGTGKEALTLFQENHIDCIILDIGLPDMSGFDLIHKLENIKSHNIPPVIIYTGRELTKEENNELQKYAESIIIKGVKSEERLLDETALFLHRAISNLPKSKQQIINNLYDREAVFHSKKILLVDDDSRNVFALSKVLQERGMEIIKAENGKNALEILSTHADIDLVLMDIMMPEMDGYEAMKQIRSQVKLKKLPVIAITAKAMKDDKQKCMDAGANDYITKPIEVERLLSLMRVWLSK